MSGDIPDDMVDEERKRICWERRRTVFGTNLEVIGWVCNHDQDYVRLNIYVVYSTAPGSVWTA